VHEIDLMSQNYSMQLHSSLGLLSHNVLSHNFNNFVWFFFHCCGDNIWADKNGHLWYDDKK